MGDRAHDLAADDEVAALQNLRPDRLLGGAAADGAGSAAQITVPFLSTREMLVKKESPCSASARSLLHSAVAWRTSLMFASARRICSAEARIFCSGPAAVAGGLREANARVRDLAPRAVDALDDDEDDKRKQKTDNDGEQPQPERPAGTIGLRESF